MPAYTDTIIGEGATLRVYPTWGEFTQDEVNDVIDIVNEQERLKFKMFKKICTMWRKQTMFGKDYHFSGQVVKAYDGETPSLITKAQEFSKREFPEMDANVALAVYYEADDYISKHSDDEGKHHKGKPIVGFSFGENRAVIIRRKKRKRGEDGYTKVVVPMPNGSAYVMMGERFQKDYTHEVGKGKDCRLSITVRNFK